MLAITYYNEVCLYIYFTSYAKSHPRDRGIMLRMIPTMVIGINLFEPN
jgi:hypothetical protein